MENREKPIVQVQAQYNVICIYSNDSNLVNVCEEIAKVPGKSGRQCLLVKLDFDEE